MSLNWPLAYADEKLEVDLAQHLRMTAELALCLFERELTALSRRANMSRGELAKILALSAGLHDIGKASRYYKERWEEELKRRGEARLKFRYHELVSALILLKLTSLLEEMKMDRQACMYKLVAKIISRHHAAMDGRHPSEYSSVRSLKSVEEALRRMEKHDLMKSLQGLLQIELISEELNILSLNIDRVLGELAHISEDSIKKITSIKLAVGEPRERMEDICGDVNEPIIVRALTGFLIIADNIVASNERRPTEDSPIAAYIRSWERELEPRIVKCYAIPQPRNIPYP